MPFPGQLLASGMEPMRWELPHGTRVAMSLAAHGDLRDAHRRAAWCRAWSLPEPTVLRQVHGCRIRSGPPTGSDPDGDGLTTGLLDAPIGVFGADCPPLVIAAADAVGVAHCGWRGTAAGIVSGLVDAMGTTSRHPPAEWAALVGPGVHPDDFEVDEPVLSARHWPSGCLRPGRPGRSWLDLPAAIAADCSNAGVGRVARSATTTSRDARLRSHRRDGPGYPQLMLAWRTTCAG